MSQTDLTFYEFFAGGGMARAGLGPNWRCAFANDSSPSKAAVYRANWGSGDLTLGDIAAVTTAQLPGCASLAWASFPCQDLSLAGAYAGLGELGAGALTRSGTFWHFWSLMKGLVQERRPPRIIVLENVYGALTSRGGADFVAICDALTGAGYRFGAVVIDAALFLPQSRPRLFIIGVMSDGQLPSDLASSGPTDWHPPALTRAHSQMSPVAKERWVWWHLPAVPVRVAQLSDVIEDDVKGVVWHTDAETERLVGMMSVGNREKIEKAKRAGGQQVGAVYIRTRRDETGLKRQRAEVRFDGLAGCLRTPGGGSSRQTLIFVESDRVRSRLLSAREAARLMGLPDTYAMPERYNDAYHLAGDGVCVAVVRFLSMSLLERLAAVPGSTVFSAAE
jgi:DNA (cytosine-5)-methyltransferase 1